MHVLIMEPAPHSISLHNFSEKIRDQLVHFHVMGMQEGFFLWVGLAPSLSSLAVAMCTRFDSVPMSTLILGDTADTTSSSFAQRLAMKTKKQVFASINIPTTNDSQLMLLIEKRVKEEMKAFPEKF